MKKIFNISITVIVTVTTVILGAFVFRSSYLGLWETLQDFGLSVAYYFSLIFKGESNITPTVNAFSNIFKASGYLPTTAEEYKRQIAKFFTAFISRDNLFSWLAGLNNIAVKVSKSFVLLFPCIIALWVITKRIYSATNTKHGENTKPLKVVLFINDKVILPVYQLIQGFIGFIKSKKYISLPFCTLEEMVIEWIYTRFIDLYEDFRFKRGDNTLLIYVLKKIAAWLYKRNAVNYNLYGYSILRIEKERGTQDGKKKKQKYYLCNRKIYNRRFSTDCFSDYFNEQARKTKVGLNDYAEYSAVKATVSELKQQNSYFINSLYKCDGEEDK